MEVSRNALKSERFFNCKMISIIYFERYRLELCYLHVYLPALFHNNPDLLKKEKFFERLEHIQFLIVSYLNLILIKFSEISF